MKKIISVLAVSSVLLFSSNQAQAAVAVDLTVGPILGVNTGVFTATSTGGVINGDVHLDILQDPNWVDLTFTTEILDTSITSILGVAANTTAVLFSDLTFGFYDRVVDSSSGVVTDTLINSIALNTQVGVDVLGLPLLFSPQTLTISNTDVTGDLFGMFTFTPGSITIPGTFLTPPIVIQNPLATATTTYSFKSTVSAVPEPSTYLMMIGGLGMVGFMAARRRKQA